MYEGILVELPFATFFLSKLKQKYISPSPSLKQVAIKILLLNVLGSFIMRFDLVQNLPMNG